MKYEITIGETTRLVDVEPAGPGQYRVRWEGEDHLVDLTRPSPEAFQMLIDGESWEAGCVAKEGGYLVDVVGVPSDVQVVDPRRRALKTSSAASSGIISTSMPGRIVRVMVEVGAVVSKGQPVVVVEAMKMENELKSPIAGTVTEIMVNAGQPVDAGVKLLRITA